MEHGSGTTLSLWMSGIEMQSRPVASEDMTADVCVVGAGIAGLTVAYKLAQEGKSVIVIDDGEIGGGETSRTTAHIVNALDERYYEIERLHGEKGARLAAESHTAAIDLIEQIVNDEKIDCDFERLDGYLFTPAGESSEVLEKELAATHRAGLIGIERVDNAPLREFLTGPALRFPRQAQFHAMKYLNGLAAAAERKGVRIFTRSHAAEFNGGDRCEVVTDSGVRIFCGAIVVATNTPVNDRLAIHTKQAAYRTYVVGLSVPRDSVPRALFWDTENPYHYVRLQPDLDNDVLIVGGEDHKTGQAEDTDARFARLEAWARGRFAMAGEVLYRWSGQVMEPNDGIAFIGRNPFNRNIYIVTGDSGNGITHGTIAGMLLPDLIAGRENEWASLYDPGRISLMSAASYAKENLNMAAQYTDLVTGGDVDAAAQIAPGEGAIIRDGATKIAAYRDDSGKLHTCSAICPHLWGVVRWNGTEKTWDCPCHGSRFDALGNVLNGPARSNLKPIDTEAPQEAAPIDPATDNGVLPYRS